MNLKRRGVGMQKSPYAVGDLMRECGQEVRQGGKNPVPQCVMRTVAELNDMSNRYAPTTKSRK